MEIIDPDKNDELLWKKAKKRVSFKKNLAAYVFVNLFLSGIWFFTGEENSKFWPIWPMLGWGLGLAFQYYDAYMTEPGYNEVEREFRSLKDRKSRQ